MLDVVIVVVALDIETFVAIAAVVVVSFTMINYARKNKKQN